jgi:hypothetical protein
MNKRACTHTVFLILWFGFFICAVSAQKDDPLYYRSNSIGMALEEISRYRINEYEYVLKRNSGEDGLSEILLKDGKEHQRAEYQWKGTLKYGRFYEQGRLSRETIEAEGRLQEERLFTSVNSKQAFERRIYEWQDGELQGVTVFRDTTDDAAGERADAAQISEEYIRSQGGKLLQVLRSGPDEDVQVSGIYSLPDSSHTHWHFTAGGKSYFFYWEQENRVSAEYLRGNLVYRKETFRGEETTIINELYPEQDTRVRSVYTPDGRILSRHTVTPSQKIQAEYSYQDGELAELLKSENGVETRILYSKGDGDRPDERVYVDGVLQKEVQYHEGNRKTVVLYRSGEAVAQVEYQGEEAVRRESLIEEDS